jgi:hypothetical protein
MVGMLKSAHDVNRLTTKSETAFAVDVSTARFSRSCCSITDGLCCPSPLLADFDGLFPQGFDPEVRRRVFVMRFVSWL